MIQQSSSHKFYNKYWYKLETINAIAHIFREKQFRYTQTCLETLKQDYSKGQQLFLSRVHIQTPVSEMDYLDCCHLYNSFVVHNIDDYMLRVENPILNIYSNNSDWLQNIANKLHNKCIFFSPGKDIKSLLNKNTPVTIVKRPIPFKYRVTLKNRVSLDFARWIDNNPGKIKIGRKAYQHISTTGFAHGYYFYITSEKVLQLVQIMIGGNISRVEEVVVDTNKDK